MIHVDVRKDPQSGDPLNPDFLVQTSVDGGPWKTQYLVAVGRDRTGNRAQEVRREAELLARAFLNGVRFMGGETRMTSCGHEA